MLREANERPGEEAEDEHVGAGRACRHDARDVLVRDERAVEQGVVAARGAHAEDVPRFLDRVALRVARHEGVHDFRCRRIARVHAVHAEARPDGRQAAKCLAAGELVAAFDLFGLRCREQPWNVVAMLGMPGGKHFACGRLLEDPLDRFVATPPQVRSVADPVVVHVERERGRRRVHRELPCLASDFGQVHARARRSPRQRHPQIARRFQLVEVFLEKPILAIVFRRSLATFG